VKRTLTDFPGSGEPKPGPSRFPDPPPESPAGFPKEIASVIKQLGFVATALAAGMAVLGGSASAAGISVDGHPVDHNEQFGLVGNVQNLDAVHNLNVVGGVCDDNVNVLGVQVPVQDVANGVGVPVLSPGAHDAEGEVPQNCAAGDIADGGTAQGN
jgi:hypothetical protein